MPKGSLELRLYEFTPEIERLMAEIEANTDEDGQWVEGSRPFEEILQDITNMERDKKEKVLALGRLILHLDECQDRHKAHAAKHEKKAKAFGTNANRLREYVKGNITDGEKFKDDFVSIYPMKTSAVIPTVAVESLPVAYRRPVMKKAGELDRETVNRLHVACLTKNIKSPFDWEVDKETLKKDVKDCDSKNVQHPFGRLETGRTVVVR